MTKSLTRKQEDFLEALLGEAHGNIRAAMDLARYSRTTKTAEVVGPLKEKITERAGMMLAPVVIGLLNNSDLPDRI